MICPKCSRTDAKAVGSVKGRKRFSCATCGSGYIDAFAENLSAPIIPLSEGAALPPPRITEDPPALPKGAALPEGGTLYKVLGIPFGASIEEIEGALKVIMDLRLWAIVKSLYPVFKEDSDKVATHTGIDPWTVEELVKLSAPEELPSVMSKAPPEYMLAEMPKIDKGTFRLSPCGYEIAKENRKHSEVIVSAHSLAPNKQLEYDFCAIDDIK